MWSAIIQQCALQGKSGMDMYKEFEVDRDQGNFDKLPELYAVLSGMKVSPPSRPVHTSNSRMGLRGGSHWVA